jgi:putative membrane protein
MLKRNFIDYLTITLKGLAMGAADAVPGVSGGTIAFITGIYEELISTLSGINFSLIKTLQKQGIDAFWKQLNGNFILALVGGIVISFVSFMRIAKYLIETQAILIWSFFFGLIVASILLIGRQIKKLTFKNSLALIF